ncbi:hypothetical protein BT67DRAFT_452790 [Trichocladium antarcticum]|uniref:Uncharacterized protein n=1 Tax=Trichocladium antarcticum TaxID=1450529 RepID=A0AAN6UE71_9PEZI|nr:hypothetical protein BT67DRAFT_452790 [Trichocladium antarcticum]
MPHMPGTPDDEPVSRISESHSPRSQPPHRAPYPPSPSSLDLHTAPTIPRMSVPRHAEPVLHLPARTVPDVPRWKHSHLPPSPSSPSSPSSPGSTSSTSSSNPSSPSDDNSFFAWASYQPYPITPRKPMSFPSKREDFMEALTNLEVRTGQFPLQGVGKLGKPLLNKARSPQLLSHFFSHAPRSLLVPQPIAPPAACNECIARRGAGDPIQIAQRELETRESDLFDTAKYTNPPTTAGENETNYLTVLTWSDDNPLGTITLFAADLTPPPAPPSPAPSALATRRSTKAGGAQRENHRAFPATLTYRARPRITGLRAVSAMEDVPRQVLVKMRADGGLRKLVLQHDARRARFEWTAQHAGSRAGLPRYARSQAGADGVVATLPQFLALLHAGRSIVEAASATAATVDKIETDDGESVRAVSLKDVPKGKRHTDRGVHVVVLVPEEANWVEERLFWTAELDGLAELRQKKYHDVVEQCRTRTNGRGRGRGGDRDWDSRSVSPMSPRSPPLSARTTVW